MAQRDERPSTKPDKPIIDPATVTEMGRKQIDAVIDLQHELVDQMEEISREWTARVKTEADLANEFASKLSAVRTVPDVAAIYQDWWKRRMELLAEDSRLFVDGSQKLVAAIGRMLPHA